jgi:hypothetical protein
MSQPTVNRVHIDAPLTNLSIAYMQSVNDFIALKVFPMVPVTKASDKYYVFPKDAWYRDEAKERAIGTKAARGGFELSTDNYSCTEYAFAYELFDRIRQNADSVLNLERNAINLVTRKGLIKLERLFANTFFKPGVWGTDIAGNASPAANQTHFWDNDSNGTPIKDVDAGKAKVLKTTGFEPNTMIIGLEVFNGLKESAIMTDKIKYTQRGVVTAEIMAQVFGVERLFVAKSIVNTAKEGQSAAMNFNFGKAAWIGYVNPEPAPEMPSAGYTFADTNVSEGMGKEVGVRQYREEDIRADIYEMELSVDMKTVGADLGYFFDGIVQ